MFPSHVTQKNENSDSIYLSSLSISFLFLSPLGVGVWVRIRLWVVRFNAIHVLRDTCGFSLREAWRRRLQSPVSAFSRAQQRQEEWLGLPSLVLMQSQPRFPWLHLSSLLNLPSLVEER